MTLTITLTLTRINKDVNHYDDDDHYGIVTYEELLAELQDIERQINGLISSLRHT